MLKDELQNEIVIKIKEGDFKLLKNGQIRELTGDELLVRQDDLIKPGQVEVVSQPKTNFYFDVDDEREIRQIKAEDNVAQNRAIRDFIENTVEDIVSQSNLNERAKHNQQLKSIILSRLKDVRSLAQAREALLRQNLDKDKINNLLSLVEKKRANIEEAIRTGKIPQRANQEQLTINKEVEKIRQMGYSKQNDKLAAQKENQTGPIYSSRPEVVAGEELTHHLTIGPVEEIKNLSLRDFRRLGTTPKEAAERILEKIGLLEDESLIKRAEGIKAWQESPVYKLYLDIGATSLSQKKPVEQTIREYKAAGKPYLAPEEFNEVADLNRKLSY